MASPQEPSLPEEEKAGALVHQLYVIKDVRAQTLQLEKMKMKVLEQHQLMKSEEERIRDYKNELELLEQEKLAHVEELRQIHADMKAMETVIKEANADRLRSLDLAWDVFKEYSALKADIDTGRHSLGLGEVPLLSVAGNVIDKQYFKKMRSQLAKETKFESMVDLVEYSMKPVLSGALPDPVPVGDCPSTSTTRGSLQVQDPPMKICQSCQQPIHRNAPVCPLCKAKNRSRQPKKLKRKHEDSS